MARDIKTYLQAWKFRQENKTFRAIGQLMGLSGERVRVMVKFIDFQKNKTKFKKEKGFIGLYLLKLNNFIRLVPVHNFHNSFINHLQLTSIAFFLALGSVLISLAVF